MHFLQLCADLNKKSKTAKAIYINESEFTYILIALFRQMLWFVGVRATVHYILAIKISKTILTQQKFNKILGLQTWIFRKSKSQYNTIFNTIFWKWVTKPFRCICLNCFNRLRQMTPFFSFTFSDLNVCNINLWI